jgi:hypothetical protein
VSDSVFVGVLAPASCVLIVTDPAMDLGTVTATDLLVLKPDGTTEVSWPTDYAYDATSKELTISHPFAAGDVDQVGNYHFFAIVTFPEGPLRSKTRSFTARTKFDTTL